MYKTEILITNYKDDRKPETREYDDYRVAVESIDRAADIAGSCFVYGKVLNSRGDKVYEFYPCPEPEYFYI